MKRHALLLMLALLSVPFHLSAQKKVIQQAQQLIKTGKELEKAEKLMTDLLKDTSNIANTKIHLTLFEAVKKQYEQGNEKLYLKQTYDTTALFNNTLKMFTILERLDSIETQQSTTQKHKSKWRDRDVAFLHSFRRNLLNGGRFFSRKQQYQRAYTFYTHYLNTAKHPLFKQYQYATTDSLMPGAAYGAMYCAYKLQQPHNVLTYAPMAEQVKRRTEYVYQFEAEAYHLLNDTTNYLQTLLKGFKHSPQFVYFFPRIVDHYIDTRQNDKAIAFVDQALLIDSLNPTFRFAQSTLLLNSGQYEQCIDICEDLIAANDSLIDAYYNIGLAYFNEAISLDKQVQNQRSRREAISQLYKKSLPFMQKVREEQPNQPEKWAQVLYTIYLNLNMGNEFDEINALLSRKKTTANNH